MNFTVWLRPALALSACTILAGTAFAAGSLRHATVGEPPGPNRHVVTSGPSTTFAHHMFERRCTFSPSNSPVGLLAIGKAVPDDRKTITFREVVKFHQGQDMATASFVVSLAR
ncbi:MAG: hypothetical protein OXF74_04360 [Rhodobacteraceae bacterium]|nr:hypothetical protein [Paracoccaceae bacterium]